MSGRLLSSAGSSSWRARPSSTAASLGRPSPASYRLLASSSGPSLLSPQQQPCLRLVRPSAAAAVWSASSTRAFGRALPRASAAPSPAPSSSPSTSKATSVPPASASGVGISSASGVAPPPGADPPLPPIYPDSPSYDARRFTAVPQHLPPSTASTSSAPPPRPLPPAHPSSPAYQLATSVAPVRRPSFLPVIPLAPTPPPRDMPPTPADYAGLWKMYFLAKEYFRFLYGGVKESFNEWRDKNRIRRAIIQDGHQMTYRDLVLFRRVKSNNRRMLPFLFLALTIEEFIPLLILFAPQFVPTTGLLPSQARKMARDLEDKLVRSRSAVFARLAQPGGVNAEDGTPVFPGGWRNEGFLEWKSEEIKEVLRVFSWPHREPTRSYLEDHARNVISFLEEDDRYLSDRPPAEGFTADEFRRILSARGLLSVDMPEDDLPAKLDAYLTAFRSTPGFSPIAYALDDIRSTQPAAEAALREREAARAKAEEEEKLANGGYSGWKAAVRKAFVERDPLPTVEKAKAVKPTDPSLSPVHSLPKANLSPSLSSRPTTTNPPTTPSPTLTPPASSDPTPPSSADAEEEYVAPRYQLTEGRKPARPAGGRPGGLSRRKAKAESGV